MGLSDGVFFMIKHTPLPNGNHPNSSPIYPMGVANTLEQAPAALNLSANIIIDGDRAASFKVWALQLSCQSYLKGPRKTPAIYTLNVN